MSAKRDRSEIAYSEEGDSDDENNEDDDEDFADDGNEDEDEDDDFADEDVQPPPESTPTFLQGNFRHDLSSGGNIVYEQDRSFRLVSHEKAPASWSLQSPVLVKPTKFVGWIQDSAETITVTIQITKQKSTIDPLDKKILVAQEENQLLSNSSDAKLQTSAESCDLQNDSKKPPPSPASSSLKDPPSYSLKSPALAGVKNPSTEPSKGEEVYVVQGSQAVSPASAERSCIKFRGVFRPPDVSLRKLFLICSVQVDQIDSQPAGAALPPAAVAARRKRSRSADDDSGDNEVAVEYQELIGLHDDAGLSTEDLKRRYYGTVGENNGGKPPAVKKRLKPSDDDDDSDDAYGF